MDLCFASWLWFSCAIFVVDIALAQETPKRVVSIAESEEVVNALTQYLANDYIDEESGKRAAEHAEKESSRRATRNRALRKNSSRPSNRMFKASSTTSTLMFGTRSTFCPKNSSLMPPTRSPSERGFDRQTRSRNRSNICRGMSGDFGIHALFALEHSKRPIDAAMNSSNQTDALILDLRNNGGGSLKPLRTCARISCPNGRSSPSYDGDRPGSPTSTGRKCWSHRYVTLASRYL